VKAEVRRAYNANPTVQIDAVCVDEIKRYVVALKAVYNLVTTNASTAVDNLDEAECQMRAAAHRDRAVKLIAEAEKERQTLLTTINAITFAKGSIGEDLSGARLGAAGKVVDVLTTAGKLTIAANDLNSSRKS
jgi:predicted phage tail protein